MTVESEINRGDTLSPAQETVMDTKTSPLAGLNDPSLLKTDALVNGEWVAGNGRFDVIDPATGEKLADVANLGAEHTHHAIVAANKAWPAWRAKTAKERAAILIDRKSTRLNSSHVALSRMPSSA